VATRGGFYFGADRGTHAKYVKNFLDFIGIADVEFICAEGLAISFEKKSKSLEQASEVIETMIL
jgi:FMN-dependent NADH-azoreductase